MGFWAKAIPRLRLLARDARTAERDELRRGRQERPRQASPRDRAAPCATRRILKTEAANRSCRRCRRQLRELRDRRATRGYRHAGHAESKLGECRRAEAAPSDALPLL